MLLVFHGFGGRLAVMDVGPTMMNQIMHYCFKEIHLRRRDLNGKNQFGKWVHLLALRKTEQTSICLLCPHRPRCRGHSAMLRSVRPSVCLSHAPRIKTAHFRQVVTTEH